jgi:exonuclease VII small subunit
MNVNGVNTTAVSWESLLSSLGEVSKGESVDGKSTFNITTNVDGEMKTVTVSVPADLEIPQNVDQGTLEGLVDKLAATGLGFTPDQVNQMKESIAQMYNSSAAALNEVSSKSKGHSMFDLYALMALMIDVAQSQRDAARELRNAQNLSIQKAIQNQADSQRDAAMVGMIVGIVCGAATAAISIGTMVGQGVAAKTQSNIMSQSGADSAKLHATALKTTDSVANANSHFEQVSAKVGGEVQQRIEADFSNQLVDDQYGNLGENFNNALSANTDAKNAVVKAETDLAASKEVQSAYLGSKNVEQAAVNEKTTVVEQKQEALNALENNINNGESNEVREANIKAAKDELTAAQKDLNDAKGRLDTATKKYDDQTKIVEGCQNELTQARAKLAQTETDFGKAKADYVKTVQDVAAQYEVKYQTAVDNLNNPPPNSNVADLKAAVTSARNDMEMAFAKEAQLLSKYGVMTPSEQKDLVAASRARVDTTMDRVINRTDFKGAERKMVTLTGINNINQSIGGILQSTANNLSAIQNAEATRQGAESKREEEMLDQTKDLFQQEQTLINQIVQLFSAVIQAENQSMRDAIQA